MADGNNSEGSLPVQCSSPDQRQSDQIARLAKRLYLAANGVAQALLPVIYLRVSSSDTQDIGALVQKVYALAGLLFTLLDDLTLETVTRGEGHPKEMWSKEHYTNLSQSMEKCHDDFLTTASMVRLADERFHVKGLKSSESYMDGFNLSFDANKTQDLVEKCFRLVAQTRLIVKHTSLARLENLDDKEIQEALRLTTALQKPEFDAIWALKDDPFASKRLRAVFNPTQPAAAAPTSSRDDQQQHPQNQPLDSHSKPIWAYGIWPPSGYPQYSPSAVASTQETISCDGGLPTPAFTDYSGQPSRNTAPNVVPGAITFGQPSVIKPLSLGNYTSERKISTGPFASWKSPNVNPFDLTPHLEAYVIRPKTETTDLAFTLFYELESLRLSQVILQAKVQNLGSEHSVMDALLNLQPQIMNLVQLRTKLRQGNIVSIENGRCVEFPTLAGSLQVNPVIFIISTTTMLPQEPVPIPALIPEPVNADPRHTPGTGLFKNVAPTPLFGSSNSGFGMPNQPLLSSPEAYSKYLQEQGNVCTHVEKADSNSHALQHYETITANKNWHGRDRSIEEIRLADYNAGRKRPLNANGASYPWDSVSTGMETLFGSAQPAKVETSKSEWPPATTNPTTAGPIFGSVAPKASHHAQNTYTAKQSSSAPYQFDRKSWNSPAPSPFDSVASNLPPFVPPTQTQIRDTMSHLPPKTPQSDAFCKIQHDHSIFCPLPRPQNTNSRFNTSPSSTPITGASTLAKPTSSVQHAPKPILFDATLATQKSENPFGPPTSRSNAIRLRGTMTLGNFCASAGPISPSISGTIKSDFPRSDRQCPSSTGATNAGVTSGPTNSGASEAYCVGDTAQDEISEATSGAEKEVGIR